MFGFFLLPASFKKDRINRSKNYFIRVLTFTIMGFKCFLVVESSLPNGKFVNKSRHKVAIIKAVCV